LSSLVGLLATRGFAVRQGSTLLTS
jgi:hypothetical protein